jgi:HEAT repeat protein
MRWNKKQGSKQGLGIGDWGLVWDWGLAFVALRRYLALTLCVGLGPYVGLGPFVGLGFSRAVAAQQHTFDEVAAGLKHHDANTRLRAIQILKDADYPEAVVPIAAALADVDDRVQLAAIDAERSLFSTRLVPRRKMIGFVIEVRTVAGGDAAAAGQLALKARPVPTQLLTSLAVALRDGNPRVRAEAINLAMLVGPVACAPVAQRSVRLQAAVDAAAAGLAKARTDRASDGGQAHADACSQIGNALVDNINSPEAPLRRAAMQALGQLRYPNAVQALTDQLSYYQKGPDALAALEGLAGIGHPTSVSLFEESLASSNADVRRLAVEGLARADHREALPALQQMGQAERAVGVLLALHYANVKLGDVDDSLQTLVASLRNASQRPVALVYLLDLSVSKAPELAASLKDPSEDVRRLVVDVLGFSRNPTVIPALEATSKDPDPDVAAAALQAIERLKL